MFFTYLWRELRRRARQAIFIAMGLALGIGLVITVTAASAGVKNAQSSVLHSLYGVGTDITVTKAPDRRRCDRRRVRVQLPAVDRHRPAARRPAARSTTTRCPPTSRSSSITSRRDQHRQAGQRGGRGGRPHADRPHDQRHGPGAQLQRRRWRQSGRQRQLQQRRAVTPAASARNFNTNSFTVNGVDIANGELGPLSAPGRSAPGGPSPRPTTRPRTSRSSTPVTPRTNKLKVGSTIAVGNSKDAATNFTVVGIVSEPAGDSPSDVYIPLGVAQSLANLKNDVNTIYVTASKQRRHQPRWRARSPRRCPARP